MNTMEQTPFPYSNTNKRYHTFTYHLQQKFGEKIFKVSLNGGFTCPNIDGTKSVGGCIYCSGHGSGDFAGDVHEPLAMQFETVKNRMHQKWPNAKYLAYFQAFTNTYAPVEKLRAMYEEVLTYPNVVGLFIATRPDCLPDEVVDLLSELSKKTYLVVELGLQTISDSVGEFINRGHTYREFLQGYNKLKEKHINICVHIINGLPGETKVDMLQTVKTLAPLGLHSIKIHLLHVLKHTQLATMYERGEFPLMTRDEYVDTVCDQLELLPPETVIQRITGDGEKESLIGPLWSLKKFVVMNEIDKELVRRNSYQGKFFIKE